MTELIPTSSNNSNFPKGLQNKRVLLGVIAGVVLVAALFGFSSWQASSKLKSDLANIEQLIKKDNFSAAQTAITAALADNENNAQLKALENKIDDLQNSKTKFEVGSNFLTEKNYQSALDELKYVVEIDTARFAQAQSKIDQAKTALAVEALAEAQNLKGKKKYNDALAVVNRATAYIVASAELKALKAELEPLALAEIKRAEEKQLAVYRNALKKMRVEKDKFNGTKFYTDRSTPYYANYSTFHLYIGKNGDSDPYLRFKVRYSDEDWLFVESASINIDGDIRDLDVGNEWERDNGSGDIWEWVDVNATESHLSLVRDVIKSKKAVIRYFGSKYRDDRVISSAQKRALQNVLDAYEALKRL